MLACSLAGAYCFFLQKPLPGSFFSAGYVLLSVFLLTHFKPRSSQLEKTIAPPEPPAAPLPQAKRTPRKTPHR